MAAHSATRTLALLVFAATLALYLATLTGVHTFDALSYILDVQRKPWRELFHPHHLAYGPLGWAAFHSAEALGYQGTANLPLQMLNALAGAAGAALFCTTLLRLTAKPLIALACSALLATSYAYWYYAVEVEVYTFATLFLIACLWQLSRLLARPTPTGWALLGLLQGGAVLFHQTNALLCVPLAVLLLSEPGGSARLRHGAAYGATLGLAVGLPYAAVALLSGFTNWPALRGWLLGYATTGWWGGPLTSNTWANLGTGLSLTLAATGGWLACLLLLVLLLLHSRSLLRAQGATRRLVLGALAWLLSYGAFFVWWEPDNPEFWIASLPPFLLLLALSLAGHTGRRQPGAWAALLLAAVLGWNNSAAIAQRGDPATDLQRQLVDALVAASAPDDLLLVPDGLQELYLPFYAGRFAYYSWNQAFYDHGPAWSAVCSAVRGRIDDALHAGAAVVLADEVLHPPPVLQRRHGITTADVATCLDRYAASFAPLPMPAAQPPAARLAGANELAAGAGWRFDAFSQGWRGSNSAAEQFVGGWRFVPQTDPALLSPRLSIAATSFRAAEITLEAAEPGELQLFWAGPDGALREEHSLRVRLQRGRTTYRLDLASAPGWQGTITRLRLDPIARGAGQQMLLVAIRLVGR